MEWEEQMLEVKIPLVKGFRRRFFLFWDMVIKQKRFEVRLEITPPDTKVNVYLGEVVLRVK